VKDRHSASPRSGRGIGLARRIRGPRALGLGLGALCVAGALAQHGAAPWVWALLVFNGFAWPHVAYAWAQRSRDPHAAEHRNLLIDSLLGGFWVPAMAFNVLPSTLIVTMLAMDNLAVGGGRLFARGLVALAAGAAAAALLLGVHVEPAASLTTVVAALPFLVVFPLTIGFTTYKLSMRLARERAQAQQSARLHQATLDAMQAGIVLYDADDRLVLCNDDFRRLYGALAPLLVPGIRFEELVREALARGLVPQARGDEERWLHERLRRHADPAGAVIREFAGDRWRRIVEQRLPDGSLLAFSTDVTDLVRNERELRRLNDERDAFARQLQVLNSRLHRLSLTDPLTGLANRRLFELRLGEEWQRAQRHGIPLSLLIVDVDHFKRFNDRHGHPAGDACLRQLAERLASCARRAGDLVARLGGEEFVLLLPHCDAAEAAETARRCLAAIDAAAIAHGDSPVSDHVSVSIGVAQARFDGSMNDSSALVDAADAALYRGKSAGRGRVVAASCPVPLA
jgi:diguanylate cyclase (GGDEF)-like protein